MVVVGGPAWLLPPQPDVPRASATDSTTTSRPPSRRLRGNTNSSRDAIAIPEPAANLNGVRAGLCLASMVPASIIPGMLGRRRLAVIPLRVREVVAVPLALSVTAIGLSEMLGEYPLVVSVREYEKFTVPVKPLREVAVIVTG